MRKQPKRVWEEIRAQYEVHDKSVRSIGDAFGVAESSIRTRAKSGNWKRLEHAHIIEKKVRVAKELREIAAQTSVLSARNNEIIDECAKKELEIQGLYGSFEAALVKKADLQLSKVKPTEENAVDNVVKLTTAIKNVRPPAPAAQVNVQQNTYNTLNLADVSRELDELDAMVLDGD